MNATTASGLQEKSASLRLWVCASALLVAILLSLPAAAQSCLAASDMDAATRTALENAGKRYFDMAAKGDVFNLKQSAISSLAANFAGIESAVIENKDAFAGAQASPRPPFLLDAEGTQPLARAEFLCGVFGSQGQTPNSAVFVIPNLPPGKYAIVIMDVTGGAKGPYTLSFVLQQIGNDWKIGGFYAKAGQVAGHDVKWYTDQAEQSKAKGQVHLAWLFYREARFLSAPLDFMTTMQTDRLYDTIQSMQPADMPDPATGKTATLVGGNGKTYTITDVFPVAVANDLDLVVKYQNPDVSNTAQTFQDNMAVIKALVTKYPEFRNTFAAVVARAVQPDGRDYGSLMPVKDIK